uniref:Uncharacterized protein n=1 Tax=Opuntia streptacantha TaxID=393608 RepID=A0A7C9ERX0_OPUST
MAHKTTHRWVRQYLWLLHPPPMNHPSLSYPLLEPLWECLVYRGAPSGRPQGDKKRHVGHFKPQEQLLELAPLEGHLTSQGAEHHRAWPEPDQPLGPFRVKWHSRIRVRQDRTR